MVKIMMGLLLGVAIGAGCRWFDIPVPSPPRLVGALLVVGYMATDKLVAAKLNGRREATTRDLCGGPTGTPASIARR